jgi:hypothetical protein
LREISGAGSGIHAQGREFAHALGDADRVQVAGHDLCARMAEGERDGIPDLARAADTGDEDDLALEVVGGRAH